MNDTGSKRKKAHNFIIKGQKRNNGTIDLTCESFALIALSVMIWVAATVSHYLDRAYGRT